MPSYGAVDIGSNSVRMMVADMTPAGFQVLEEDRAVTRLGASVFLHGRIAEYALQFVCEKLAKWGETIRKHEPAGLRAVGTSAVRDASNQREFLQRTQQALGAPIEIVSGQEEARLIQLGVQLRWPLPEERVLIVDVGGGSAEIILSEYGTLAQAFSKPLGSVRLAEVFLKDDPPKPVQLRQMTEYIDEKLASAVKDIKGPFDRSIATSATAAALVCAANGVDRSNRNEADRLSATTQQVRAVYERVSTLDLAARRKMTGIGPRRAELIVAGAAVFLRTLEMFGHGSIYYSVAGVRDGILADLSARRVGHELSQLNSGQRHVVEDMSRKYGVKQQHATQVALLARQLFEGLQSLHRLPPYCGKILEAAAFLHDIGHFVNPTGHHKHSHYLVENSEMPGFTDSERHFIAALCRYHRKTAPAPKHALFETLEPAERSAVTLLTPLLRLADSLDRGHAQRVQGLQIEFVNGRPTIALQTAAETHLELWAAARAADLFRETYGVALLGL